MTKAKANGYGNGPTLSQMVPNGPKIIPNDPTIVKYGPRMSKWS